EILPAWEERQDGAVIAGWCHAAPGRGIALSNFHRFNHHRHFPRPWQIVLVIDTARQASLVYRWEKGQLVPVEGFYYWDMEGEPAADLFEPRSEEHTSALQSRENLVCRLLLEKKKRMS